MDYKTEFVRVPRAALVANCHWTLGGTGIVNVNIEDIVMYQQAIIAYADSNLYLEPNPMGNAFLGEGNRCYSLHYRVAADKVDLSNFWKLIEKARGGNY